MKFPTLSIQHKAKKATALQSHLIPLTCFIVKAQEEQEKKCLEFFAEEGLCAVDLKGFLASDKQDKMR